MLRHSPTWHRCRLAGVPQPGLRTFHQHRLHGGASHRAEHGGLCWHQIRRSHHLRGPVSRSRPQAARHRDFTRTNFADPMAHPELKAQTIVLMAKFAMPPAAIAVPSRSRPSSQPMSMSARSLSGPPRRVDAVPGYGPTETHSKARCRTSPRPPPRNARFGTGFAGSAYEYRGTAARTGCRERLHRCQRP